MRTTIIETTNNSYSVLETLNDLDNQGTLRLFGVEYVDVKEIIEVDKKQTTQLRLIAVNQIISISETR